jgi:hypothetical protein
VTYFGTKGKTHESINAASLQASQPGLNLGIKVKERINAVPKLRLNPLATAFHNMHRHLGLMPILQLDRGSLHRLNLIRRQQPQSIHQYQISHISILRRKEQEPGVRAQVSACGQLVV